MLQKIENKIKTKYEEITHSQEYLANKPRLEYLHNKLAHIKNVVHTYDAAILDQW